MFCNFNWKSSIILTIFKCSLNSKEPKRRFELVNISLFSLSFLPPPKYVFCRQNILMGLEITKDEYHHPSIYNLNFSSQISLLQWQHSERVSWPMSEGSGECVEVWRHDSSCQNSLSVMTPAGLRQRSLTARYSNIKLITSFTLSSSAEADIIWSDGK